MPQIPSLGMCFACFNKKPCLFHTFSILFSIFVYTLLSTLQMPGLSFIVVGFEISSASLGCYVFSKHWCCMFTPSPLTSLFFGVEWQPEIREAGDRWSSLWSMWGRWSCNLDEQPAGEGKSRSYLGKLEQTWENQRRQDFPHGFVFFWHAVGRNMPFFFHILRLLSRFAMANHGGTAEKWEFSRIHVGIIQYLTWYVNIYIFPENVLSTVSTSHGLCKCLLLVVTRGRAASSLHLKLAVLRWIAYKVNGLLGVCAVWLVEACGLQGFPVVSCDRDIVLPTCNKQGGGRCGCDEPWSQQSMDALMSITIEWWWPSFSK